MGIILRRKTSNKHKEYVESEKKIVHRTKCGEPTAFLEVEQSQFQRKVIRSAKCSIFLPNNDICSSQNTCDSCKQSEHYMRYLKCVKLKHKSGEPSRFTRLDYLTREQLENVARQSATKLKLLNSKITKTKRKYCKNGGSRQSTDKDLRELFQSLHKGILEKRKKVENPWCKWG